MFAGVARVSCDFTLRTSRNRYRVVMDTKVLRCSSESGRRICFEHISLLDSSRLQVLFFPPFNCIRSATRDYSNNLVLVLSLVHGTNVRSTSRISHSFLLLSSYQHHQCSITLLRNTTLRFGATDHQLETNRIEDRIKEVGSKSSVVRKECLICSRKWEKKVWSQLAVGPVTKQSRRKRTAGLTCFTTITDNSGLGVRAGAGRLFPGFWSRARRRCRKGSSTASSVLIISVSPYSFPIYKFFCPSSACSAPSFTTPCTSTSSTPLSIGSPPDVSTTGVHILFSRKKAWWPWVE